MKSLSLIVSASILCLMSMQVEAQNQMDYEALCQNRESYGFSQEQCDRWIREQKQRSPNNTSEYRQSTANPVVIGQKVGSPYNLVEIRAIKGSSDQESVLYQTVREPKLWAFSGIGAMIRFLHVSRVVVSPILIAGV